MDFETKDLIFLMTVLFQYKFDPMDFETFDDDDEKEYYKV